MIDSLKDTPGYLNPAAIEQLAAEATMMSDTVEAMVEVIVYDNGLWKCAPDPRHQRNVDDIRKAYERGRWMDCKIYKIPKRVLTA